MRGAAITALLNLEDDMDGLQETIDALREMREPMKDMADALERYDDAMRSDEHYDRQVDGEIVKGEASRLRNEQGRKQSE